MNPNLPNPAHAYLQRQAEQATPLQAILMLLDGMVKFTQQAKDAILRGEIEARYTANRRAMEITTFLISQPEAAAQGEPAAKLIAILSAILKRQMQIDFKNAPEPCDEVLGLIRQLRSGFASLQPNKVVAGPDSTTAPRPLAASA